MRSQKQIDASRANGARSKGPVTEQGKRNSSKNSLRHGLLAQTVVLEVESKDRFLSLLHDYIEEYKPATPSQMTLVETMTIAQWRLLRVVGAQKTSLDRDIAQQNGANSVRVLNALKCASDPAGHPDVLHRYEISYDRQFNRALSKLLLLQDRRPESTEGQTWNEEAPAAERTQEVVESTATIAKRYDNARSANPAVNPSASAPQSTEPPAQASGLKKVPGRKPSTPE